jgi:hypothetical protein
VSGEVLDTKRIRIKFNEKIVIFGEFIYGEKIFS